jgi:putative ribosome biogenesis GTPase RsgA
VVANKVDLTAQSSREIWPLPSLGYPVIYTQKDGRCERSAEVAGGQISVLISGVENPAYERGPTAQPQVRDEPATSKGRHTTVVQMFLGWEWGYVADTA